MDITKVSLAKARGPAVPSGSSSWEKVILIPSRFDSDAISCSNVSAW